MIDANSKTNSFLKAIEKYAEEQKSMMRAEVEAFREEQLRRANEEGTAAAFAFIQKEKAEFNAALAKENSLKETAVKRELFEKRNKMAELIFEEAYKKLEDYSKDKKYKEYIKQCAERISEYVGKAKVIVYIAEKDKSYESMIASAFTECEVVYDNTIKLGGVRCYCEESSIIADETLDSKFEAQKKIFVESSGFTIE